MPRAAAWLDELSDEFSISLSRVHRLRNAILHGYPIEPEVIESSTTFARSISIHAVHGLVDAYGLGIDPAAHFDSLQDDYGLCRTNLEAGMAPADAFRWKAGL